MVGREKNTYFPFGLCFSEWLVMAEGVDASIGEWLKALAHYARPEERRILDSLIDTGLLRMVEGKTGEYELRQDYDGVVKAVLKEKRKEDMNWLAFALGYLSVKAFRKEDLEIAIDKLESMKAAGEVTRAEVGRLGWMQLGASMLERILDRSRAAAQMSRTMSRKMAEKGEVAEEDMKLIRLVAREGEMELYYLPPVSKEDDVAARHRLLCKYGKDTGWCTANPTGTYHTAYKDVGIFILHSGGKPKYQFVDCDGTDERPHEEDEEGGDGGESIYQFKDVDDNEVYTITARESNFIKKNADISCYGLAAEGFDSLEDFMSSSDEKARASSGSVASQVLIMAGDSAGKVAVRLGPALSRMNRNQVYAVAKSDSWGPAMADQILTALADPLRELLVKEKGTNRQPESSGASGLLVQALASTSSSAEKARSFAALIDGNQVREIFRLKGDKGDDELLKAILEANKDADGAVIQSVVSKARDLKGILEAAGDRIALLFGPNNFIAGVYEALRGRDDGSLGTLSQFLEKSVLELPPDAVTWVLQASPDAEAAAKRMLSLDLDAERMKKIFEFPQLAHLADDSHIKAIAKSRDKKGNEWGRITGLAGRLGNLRGDARLDNMMRFLRNSEDLEGHEVMSVIKKAAEEGLAEKAVESMPQEMIDLISLEDLEEEAKIADKSCKNHYGVKEREPAGCSGGRTLVALLKRTRLKFPMRYASFMKEGKERDDLMIKNLEGASTRDFRHALDISGDVDRFAEELIRVRGGRLEPGEIAAIIVHSKDKKKSLERFGDKIHTLDAPYESYDAEVRRVYSYEEGVENWMDHITSYSSVAELADELLALYKKPLRPKTIANLVRHSKREGRKSMMEKMEKHIRGLDSKSYVDLQRQIRQDAGAESIVALDEVRNGGPAEEGDFVVAHSSVNFKVDSAPDGESRWMVGKNFYSHDKTGMGRPEQMKYRIVGVDGDSLVVSPEGKLEASVHNQKVTIDGKWRLKAEKENFARID